MQREWDMSGYLSQNQQARGEGNIEGERVNLIKLSPFLQKSF